MNIAVVGAGYVGTSVAMLLDRYHNVTIVDIDANKVDKINNRISPIKDDGIENYIPSARLKATTDTQEACKKADFVIIAVPTNYDMFLQRFNTYTLEGVVRQICKVSNAKIVIKSTVPVGCTEEISKKYDNVIMFSPEFLREGNALRDNLYPSRIIVGCNPCHKDYAQQFADIMEQASECDAPIYIVGIKEAEAVKLFANTYLAMRVSFFNELDSFAIVNKLCSKDIIKGVCADPRIGDFYNNPSFGYGGYCLPKDTKQLRSSFKGTPQSLVSAVIQSNGMRKYFLADDIRQAAINGRDKATVGVYKLAMKAGSDNYRESAIVDILDMVEDANIEVIVYEPSLQDDKFLNHNVVKEFDEFIRCSDLIIANRVDEELRNADALDKVYTRDVYNRYTFAQKATMVNSGGLASMRNQESEDESILILKKNFGSSVKLKGRSFMIKNGKAVEKKGKNNSQYYRIF